MENSVNIEFFYEKQPFGIRLSKDDQNFVKENYQDLFDTDEPVAPGKAFMMLIEKALMKIRNAGKSQQKDLDKITELEKINVDLVEQASKAIKELKELSEASDKKDAEIKRLSDELAVKPKEVERTVEKEVEMRLPPNACVVNFDDFGLFLLNETAKALKVEPGKILENMFLNYTKNTGDYEIFFKRIWTKSQLIELAKKFKNSSKE